MNKIRLSCRAVFLVLLGASASFGFGQDFKVESLKNLKAIDVVVEGVSSEGRQTGLTTDQIETDVELQLRKVGITIDESVSEYLYVNANIMKLESRDSYIYGISVAVWQPAYLRRDSSILTFGAATWDKSTVGITPGNFAKNNIREAIRELVDQFLNDYLSVNPITRN